MLSEQNSRKLEAVKEYVSWWFRGRPLPGPGLFKIGRLRREARDRPFVAFVESGTLNGDTVAAMRRHFPMVYSIEVEPTLHEKARQRFAADPGVEILRGDSGEVLPILFGRAGAFDGPVLFWLDGHYSGGNTGKGVLETPIMQELLCVLGRPKGDVILIDDARCFGSLPDYPGIEELKAMVRERRPDLAWDLRDDIIKLS